MDAHSTSLTNFIDTGKTIFDIPIYQRNYNWKLSHCKTLFEDISAIAINDYDHFLGTIVFIVEESGPEYYIYSIIDGQQRLTTIMLLLKALADTTQEKELRDEIYEDYLINKRVPEDYKIKLRPQKNDFQVFNKLIENKQQEASNNQILTNYEYFVDLIKSSQLTPEEIYRGIKRLQIVYIKLFQNDENPQLIFESLNSTGLDLTQSDLIRNFLLMGLDSTRQEYYYKEYWMKIEKWLTNSMISDFIRDYLTLKTGNIPNKNSVYSEFKKYFRHNEKDLNIEKFFEELVIYAKYYQWLIFSNSESPEINQKLLNLNSLKSTVLYPFLLYIFKECFYEKNITESELIDSLDLLIGYLVRRSLCNLPSNALNKVFKALAKDLEKENYNSITNGIIDQLSKRKGNMIFPSDQFLQESLKSLKISKLPSLKLILEEIERRNNKEIVDFDNTTLEHIMPQKLSKEWKQDLGKNWEDIHEKYIDNIGNITLTGYNSELSNSSYQIKKQIYKDSNISITRSLAHRYPKWNEREILDRNYQIFKEIIKIWPCPSKINGQTNIIDFDNVYSFLDDIDVTGLKPSELSIDDTIFKVSSWKDLVKELANYLYDYDNEILESLTKDEEFKGKNGKRFIDDNKEKMIRPYKLSENLYIETTRNANTLIKFCNKLISKYKDLNNDQFSFKLRDNR